MKVGDKVKIKGRNHTGTLMWRDPKDGMWLVEIKGFKDGHNGEGFAPQSIQDQIKPNSGWHFGEDSLSLMKREWVYLLIAFGETEDRVLEVSRNEKELKRKKAWLEANLFDYEYGLIKKRLK